VHEVLLGFFRFQKYYTPIINGCVFEEQKHDDLEYYSSKPFRFSSNSNSGYYSNSNIDNSDYNSNTYDKKIKTKKCKIFMDEEYLNLISKKAGVNIKEGLNTFSKNKNINNYISNNYKYIFKHLCQALHILHKNNIFHRDIKSQNTMIDYNPRTNKAKITIIDFGLSILMDKENKLSMTRMYEITEGGSEYYTPIEIYVIRILLKQLKKNNYKIPSNLDKKVIGKVIDEYDQNIQHLTEVFHFGENGFELINGKLSKKDSNYSPKYCNTETIYNTYNIIFDLVRKNKLDNSFYNSSLSSIVYKWDVFSLGLLFAEILIKTNINDILAYDLVNKMVSSNFTKRFNIKECLEHPLFSKKFKSTKAMSTKAMSTKSISNQIEKAIYNHNPIYINKKSKKHNKISKNIILSKIKSLK
jgi:serine/threonine protein kinase